MTRAVRALSAPALPAFCPGMMRVDILSDRFTCSVPPLYAQLEQAGCFDPRSEAHLQFTDLLWYDADQIARWRPDPRQVAGLIPFAETLGGDLWCWFPAIDPRLELPVVQCPAEDEVALLYAPDFTAFCYRAIIDECAHTFLVERAGLAQAGVLLHAWMERLAEYFPAAWARRLTGLQVRALAVQEAWFYGLIDEDEARAIARADIAYDRLDEEFSHLREEETS